MDPSIPSIPCLTNPSHSLNTHTFSPSPSSLAPSPLPLSIPPCLSTPPHPFHPPPPSHPLRINIEGPLLAIQRLLPDVSWHTTHSTPDFPMPGGPRLAALAFEALYKRRCGDVLGDMVVRDEYRGSVDRSPVIDYYGVTFDHLVPPHDSNPEVLQLNIVEIEDDDGVYANRYHNFTIDPKEYVGMKVLCVPRCCSVRKGSTDRRRVNGLVVERMGGSGGVSIGG